jgi:hypothetical protein
MLTTRARSTPAVHSIAAMTEDSVISQSPTLAETSRTPGATPRCRPSDAAPVPARIEATAVP